LPQFSTPNSNSGHTQNHLEIAKMKAFLLASLALSMLFLFASARLEATVISATVGGKPVDPASIKLQTNPLNQTSIRSNFPAVNRVYPISTWNWCGFRNSIALDKSTDRSM
jgi:hypothetical protein